MKDLVIKGNRIKRELIILGIMFLFAAIINVIGIIKHDTRWIELLSQLHVVIILMFILYALLWLVRAIIYLVTFPFRNKKNSKK
ncbi:MAG: hypothetical protein RQ743_01420 [Bacteroidales bacterium]|nr:hypothetical protein [Bacteroidales bacterium]